MATKILCLSVLLLTCHFDTAVALSSGSQNPSCSLKDYFSNGAIDLSQYRGKVVYLDFWASWCAPCVESMPFMDALSREFASKGLVVLGVNLDEDKEEANVFLSKHPTKINLAKDSSGECPVEFGVETMPTSFIIDRKGIIRHVQKGFRSNEKKEIQALIEKMLSEP